MGAFYIAVFSPAKRYDRQLLRAYTVQPVLVATQGITFYSKGGRGRLAAWLAEETEQRYEVV